MSRELKDFPGLATQGLSRRSSMAGVVVGHLVGVTDDGEPLVDFAGSVGPVPARYTVPASWEELLKLANEQREVVLAFEGNEPERPIITGILQRARRRLAGDGEPVAPFPVTVVVDGRSIRLEAREELVLSCGAASITLKANGEVVTRGTHLESNSEGANWLFGAEILVG